MVTPKQAGFFMPGEWAPHARSWMAWPSRRDLWGARHGEAEASYAAVARAIARFEPLTMVANDQDTARAQAMCGDEIEVLALPIDDSWMRDSGPSFVVDGDGMVAGVDWEFNAWGGKFPPWDQDAALAGRVLQRLDMCAFKAPFVLEGGSIHVDGEGTILTTEQCLLHPNRNPGLSRDNIEALLKTWLGGETVIWLGEGLENDHTDGHVDDIACFVRPGVVMAAVCDDTSDANYAPLRDNLRRLREARDARGRSLEVIEMPLPTRRVVPGVGRLASSYVNFYIANGGIIVPGFDDAHDGRARDILAAAFPERQVVMVPCSVIIEGGGSVHCITQQQPAGPAAPRI